VAFTFKGGKLTKVKEEERQAAYNPSSPQSKAVQAGGGGKGSARDIEFTDGKPTEEQRNRILASQNDNRFGYYDMNTGKYVPAYIDAIDGGGKNTSGEFFEGAGLYSGLLNLAGVAPYGFNRPRTYAQAGMQNRPTGLPSAQPSTTTANVTSNELPSANTMGSDANMGVGTMPTNQMMDPNPMMSVEQIKNMVDPLIQGLLAPEFRQVQPMDIIAMMRDEEMRRRNQPPTLLG
tara:strand:+ start:1894 stop:2592 length:699 start_codon:yes stop_codon:yes gene_type:complete